MSLLGKLRASWNTATDRHKALRAEWELLEGRRLMSSGTGTSNDVYPGYGYAWPGLCPPETSEGPVRYFDGRALVESTDFQSQGFGESWGHTRSWAPVGASGVNGNRWNVNALPRLVQTDANTVIAVDSGLGQRWFDYVGSEATGSFVARVDVKDVLKHDSGTGRYTLTDADGGKTVYEDFNNAAARKRGQFVSYTGPTGQTLTADYFVGADSALPGYSLDRIKKLSRTDGTTTESFEYQYDDDTTGRIGKVIWKHGTTIVRQVSYAYYGTGSGDGNNGDLKLVTIQDGETTPNTIEQKHYRYWTSGNGYVGQLKYVFEGDTYAKMKAAGITDPSTAAEATVAPYADIYFEEYDTSGRVKKEVVGANGCSVCSGGLGTFKFDYEVVGYDGTPETLAPNTWLRKTVETLPDATPSDDTDNDRNIVYTNEAGQVMLRAFIEAEESGYTGPWWRWYTRYDDSGRPVLEAGPTAVTGHNESNPDLVNDLGGGDFQYLSDATGEITLTDYGRADSATAATSSTAGDATGYERYRMARRGDVGPQKSVTSITFVGTTATVTTSGAHGYSANDKAVIKGATEAVYNGTFTVTPHGTDPAKFTYTLPSTPTANAAGTITSEKVVSAATSSYVGGGTDVTTVTLTLAGNGYAAGNAVVVSGMTQVAYNGTFELTAATSTTFSYQVKGNPGSATLGTTVRVSRPVIEGRTRYLKREAGTGGPVSYPIAARAVWTGADQTGKEETTYAYDAWYTDTSRPKKVTTTHPTVTTDRNGAGAADTSVSFYDAWGRVIWEKDEGQFIHYTEYDQASGAAKKRIRDVKYSSLSGAEQTSFGLTGWSQPSSGLHLTTTADVDRLGRSTRTADARENAVPGTGNVTHFFYDDDANEVRVYPDWHQVTGTSTYDTTGPVMVRRMRQSNATAYTDSASFDETLTFDMAPGNSATPLGNESITTSNIVSLSRDHYNKSGQLLFSHRYHQAPPAYPIVGASDEGTADHFHETAFKYDFRGRESFVKSPNGTIKRVVYDGLGRPVSTWIGTDDTGWTHADPSNGGTNGMKKVSENVYDTGTAGEGRLTRTTMYPGGGATPRQTRMYYDWRGRQIAAKAGAEDSEGDTITQRPITYRAYDNLGRVVDQYGHDGDQIGVTAIPEDGGTTADADGIPDQPGNKRTHDKWEYDQRGRVWRQRRIYVWWQQQTEHQHLISDRWYDARGNLIKDAPYGAPVTKYLYDGAGRPTKTFSSDGGGDTAYSHADDVVSDNVLEQVENLYDEDGNAILSTRRQRLHSDANTGALESLTVNPKARVSYQAVWYDRAGRLTESLDIGTNGNSAYTRTSTAPNPSTIADKDNQLVTRYGYTSDEVQVITLSGPISSGTYTLTFNGQTTSAIQWDAAPSTVDAALEALSTIAANEVAVVGMPGGRYVIRFTGGLAGTNVSSITATASLSGGFLALGTTQHGGVDASDVQQVTDPRAIVTRMDYDLLGRSTRTIEGYVDGAPSSADDRITERTYDGAGNVRALTAFLPSDKFQVTEYVYGVTIAGGSTISTNDLLGQVRYPNESTGYASASATERRTYTYNGVGETITMTDPNGTVHAYGRNLLGRLTNDTITTFGSGVDSTTTGTGVTYYTFFGQPFQVGTFGTTGNQTQREYSVFGDLLSESQEHSGGVNGSSLKVQYNWSVSSGANHDRLRYVTYPNGRVLHVGYGTSGSVDDKIGRVTFLADNNAGAIVTPYLEQYTYLGLGTIVKRASGNGVTLSHAEGAGSDPYTGLDRFGRVIDHAWVKSGGNTDHFRYAYDRAGNRLYKENVLSAAKSELYHGDAGTSDSDNSAYDALGRLKTFQRGTLSASGSNYNNGRLDTSTGTDKTWTLDALGNWSGVTGESQARTHDARNQLTGKDGVTLTYDHNGNLTQDERGYQYVYDAWNRVVKIKDGTPSHNVVVTYVYDAYGRRIRETKGGVTTDFYYDGWQVIEERVSGSVKNQYVWSSAYIDAMVVRDSDADASSATGRLGNNADPATGPTTGLEQRLYVQQDANFNVTAVADTSGAMQERYEYDPYGSFTVLDANWANDADGTSDVAWEQLHQGGWWEAEGRSLHFRNRDYDVVHGRWRQADPMGYVDGMSFYQYLGSNTVARLDPMGMEWSGRSGNDVTPADQSWIDEYESSSPTRLRIDLLGPSFPEDPNTVVGLGPSSIDMTDTTDLGGQAGQADGCPSRCFETRLSLQVFVRPGGSPICSLLLPIVAPFAHTGMLALVRSGFGGPNSNFGDVPACSSLPCNCRKAEMIEVYDAGIEFALPFRVVLGDPSRGLGLTCSYVVTFGTAAPVQIHRVVSDH